MDRQETYMATSHVTDYKSHQNCTKSRNLLAWKSGLNLITKRNIYLLIILHIWRYGIDSCMMK